MSTKYLKGQNQPICRSEQPTTLDLAINRKTAETLGLTVSLTLLAQADEIIE
jgi:hypothetical protein